jgi:DNA-directed RNA polymerase subunit L
MELVNPKFKLLSNDDDVYRFTLSGVNVAYANALRRIILTEIPVNVIHTETYQDNQCNITVNTTRFHNEIIKQRLSSIPIHKTDLMVLPDEYILEVDVINDTDNIMYVTTEQFKLKNKKSGKYVTQDTVREIFPPCKKTASFIDFIILKPRISDTIPGEQITLTADFSINTAKVNSMYAVVGKCAYMNTPDSVKISQKLSEFEQKLITQEVSKEEIEFQKKNYEYLDAYRQFIPDSFDFVIQSIGVYDNVDILRMACNILMKKFQDLVDSIDGDTIRILNSEVTIEYCYDVILDGEDYTMGTILNYVIYEKYYKGDKLLSYCGFKKMHPHDKESILRIGFNQNSDKTECKKCLRFACIEIKEVFEKMGKLFVS